MRACAFPPRLRALVKQVIAIVKPFLAEKVLERRERWGYSYHVIPGDAALDLAPLVTRMTGQ